MTKICFLVGSVAISGGTYVIFQHASYLQKSGFDVTLAVQERYSSLTYAWHPEAAKLRIVDFERAKSEQFDLIIATWWKTALALADFKAERYAYFVQSIESRFYDEAEAPLRQLVDSTYKLPVTYVTEVSWIHKQLFEVYGRQATVVRNGVRKDLYRPKQDLMGKPISSKGLNVLVEGPFRVHFKNVGKTIQLVKKAGVRDITLLTSSPIAWVPGVKKVYSRVPITEVPSIYQSCDVLVKLSTVEGMFGPPLEMFHCGGTAVVYDVTGFDEYIEHQVNALVAPMGEDEAVVEYIVQLSKDKELLGYLKQNAFLTAEKWPSWQQSSAEFLTWIHSALEQPTGDAQVLAGLIESAWNTYKEQETIRLLQMPKSYVRNKLHGIVRRLPTKMTKAIEHSIAIYETVR